MPPIIGAAIRCITEAPEPWLQRIGINPGTLNPSGELVAKKRRPHTSAPGLPFCCPVQRRAVLALLVPSQTALDGLSSPPSPSTLRGSSRLGSTRLLYLVKRSRVCPTWTKDEGSLELCEVRRPPACTTNPLTARLSPTSSLGPSRRHRSRTPRPIHTPSRRPPRMPGARA